MKQREKIVPLAKGNVLEIGFGSGLNFNFYDSKRVEYLFALEPSAEMLAIAKRQIKEHELPIKYLHTGAEAIPLEENMIDSILITYTMCSIADLQPSFTEMRRVLKPDGQLIFCEHGIAPDPSVRKWQNFINPVWRKFSGGCNLNRDIPQLIKHAGFHFKQLDTMYIPGFKPASYNYWGVAKQSDV